MINNRKKAVVHVAKQQLGLSDAEYLDILATHGGGAQSSRDLNGRTFDAVMLHFAHLGFKSKSKARPTRRGHAPADKKRLMAKVSAICADMSLPWSYVDKIAQKVCNADRVEWCTPQDLHKVVAALVYHQRRERARRSGALAR